MQLIPRDRSIRLETGTSSTNLHILLKMIVRKSVWDAKIFDLMCVKVVSKESNVVIKG